MPTFHMNTNPSTWPKPDEVDRIRREEEFEATADFTDAVVAWVTGQQLDELAEDFKMSDEYDAAFVEWNARRVRAL